MYRKTVAGVPNTGPSILQRNCNKNNSIRPTYILFQVIRVHHRREETGVCCC
jgi:hypothetical protein